MINIKYDKIRKFQTTVHILTVQKNKDIVIMPSLGDRTRRQKLQDITHAWFDRNGFKQIAGVNGGFFGGNMILPIGLFYVDSGFLLNRSWTGDAFLELIHKEGKFIIDDVSSLEFMDKHKSANFGVSYSYSLVVDGKIDIRKGDKFKWTKQSHPRTMIGDNDEKYFFAVCEGRKKGEKGLTAIESAMVMAELGCITAINADGGGSSGMKIEGKIMNKTYANRAIADALLIYARPGAEYEIELMSKGQRAKEVIETTVYEKEKETIKKVIIEAGHGGRDPGASGNGLVEKELNLTVALEIERVLADYEVEVSLTRRDDSTISIIERAKISEKINPDLHVSIHHNAAKVTSARGAEIIHAHHDKYDDVLAIDILDRLERIGMPTRRHFTKLNARGTDWYAMIRRIWDNDTDAIITEGGFLTNAEDAKMLADDEWLKREAGCIAAAIVDYLDLQKKEKREDVSITTESAKNMYVVTANVLNARLDKMGKQINKLKKGEIVEKIGEHQDGDWYIIRKENEFIGFVSARFLKEA